MAKLLSGLLVRRVEEGYIDGTAESSELDFDIPRGLAIELMGIESNMDTGDLDGALIEMDGFVDLDGPALASNAIATETQFDARKILDSVIFLHTMQNDIITTGAAQTSERQMMWYPTDARIVTARNIGFAGFSKGASGAWNLGIWYRWLRISDDEFVGLVIDQRT